MSDVTAWSATGAVFESIPKTAQVRFVGSWVTFIWHDDNGVQFERTFPHTQVYRVDTRTETDGA
jgi:hypothetical protein